MKIRTLHFTLALAAALGALQSAAEPTVCTMSGMSRSVEVVYGQDNGTVPCEVIYSKVSENSVQSIYRANVEVGFCEARAREFLDVLRGWGWQCDANVMPDTGN